MPELPEDWDDSPDFRAELALMAVTAMTRAILRTLPETGQEFRTEMAKIEGAYFMTRRPNKSEAIRQWVATLDNEEPPAAGRR